MPDETHAVTETDRWSVNVGDHPDRTDSPLYSRSRKAMIEAVKLSQPWFYGDPPYQDHHGGSVWVYDQASKRPFIYRTCGIEWSAQFCADPAKVENVRIWTATLVAAFPMTRTWYVHALGMSPDDVRILDHSIATTDDVAAWVDSFWNASWPLPASAHIAVVGQGGKDIAGVHHVPEPIFNIQFIKRDDYELFVIDPSTGKRMAVLPVAPHGSGDGRVRLAWHPDFNVETLPDHGRILGAGHPVARAAFARQEES